MLSVNVNGGIDMLEWVPGISSQAQVYMRHVVELSR